MTSTTVDMEVNHEMYSLHNKVSLYFEVFIFGDELITNVSI